MMTMVVVSAEYSFIFVKLNEDLSVQAEKRKGKKKKKVWAVLTTHSGFWSLIIDH